MEIDKYDILKKNNRAAFQLERRIVNKQSLTNVKLLAF